jgi:tetrapyrrole methylase family protein / MazG family protein
VTAGPLRVTVISAEHLDHLPDAPTVSRSVVATSPSMPSNITVLDELDPDSSFWDASWQERFLNCLRERAKSRHVNYVVPGHPMLGDATIQVLLDEDSAGRIDLELYDEPLPVVLTEVLATLQGPTAFVDALLLSEISRQQPFSAGMLPLNSQQSVVITNLIPGAMGERVMTILARRFRRDTPVRIIPMLGQPEQSELELSEVADHAAGFPCYLAIPATVGDTFQRTPDDLQRLVARLRAPDGCPWDRDQTNQSLSRNLIEESYELLDTIESGDLRAMREEMGDFVLQALLHAQITEESGAFTFEDVVQTLIDKLVRRHPHVFSTARANDADDVVQTWDEIKRDERAAAPEKSAATSPLGDIPTSLPALMRAQSMIKRASRNGIGEETLHDLIDSTSRSLETEAERKLVSTILRAVSTAQRDGVDSEQALRVWTRGFEKAVSSSPKSKPQPM